MIALDTNNVRARFMVQDDAEQARIAGNVIDRFMGDAPGLVRLEVLLELVWVLERAHGSGRSEIARALDRLLSATALLIATTDDVGPVVELDRTDSFGFADLRITTAARRVGAADGW